MNAEQITEELWEISSQIATLQTRFYKLKEQRRAMRMKSSLSSHAGVTVFRVKSTMVRRHERRGYTAVRVYARSRKGK